MKTALFYSLLIIAAEICQFEVSARKRVIGGSNADHGQFPFIVSLRRKAKRIHFCGASIISKRILLTAAHCLCLNFKYTDLYVIAGTIYTYVYKEGEGTRYTLIKSLCHEEWKYIEEINQSTNDIALALVKETIEYTEYIKPIKLCNINVPVGAKVILVGYGCNTFKEGELLPEKLQSVTLETISNSDCQKYYKNMLVDERDICTTRNYSNIDKGGCYGDSGSPVVYKNKQVGIQFNGDESKSKSGPDMHVRVKMFLSWIKENKRKIMLSSD